METLASATSAGRRHFPSLDGMRGIAVLAVMALHWGVLGIGWIGVQIFFVLSGYLITVSLIVERERVKAPEGFATYARAFISRRTRRILPLYSLYVIGYLLIKHLSAPPGVDHVAALSLVTFTVNIVAVLVPQTDFSNIGHFWSLALEEQFYLLWPIVVYFSTGPSLRYIALCLILVSPVLRLFYSIHALASIDGISTARIYEAIKFMPQFQMDSFAAGALVASAGNMLLRATVIRSIFFALAALAVGAGLMLMVNQLAQGEVLGVARVMTFGYDFLMPKYYQLVWGYSLINLATAACILGIVKNAISFRLLELPKLVHVGRISYGLYVLHVPVLASIHMWFGPPASIGTRIGFGLVYGIISIIIAHLSFTYFESKFQFKKQCQQSL